jgi:hypothetical protein
LFFHIYLPFGKQPLNSESLFSSAPVPLLFQIEQFDKAASLLPAFLSLLLFVNSPGSCWLLAMCLFIFWLFSQRGIVSA